MIDTNTFLQKIADGLKEFDAQKKAPKIKRGPNKGKSYPPGAGSHEEPDQVLAVAKKYDWAANDIKYSQGKCDLHAHDIWAEVKLIRPFGANGKPAQHIDGTAYRVVEDAKKLSRATERGKKMVMAFAYDKDAKGSTAMPFIWDVQVLSANRGVSLKKPIIIPLERLVHPIHQFGWVVGWELL
ncbi:MAG: hypothetical protein ABSD64_03955 [Terriglobales bacterium]